MQIAVRHGITSPDGSYFSWVSIRVVQLLLVGGISFQVATWGGLSIAGSRLVVL